MVTRKDCWQERRPDEFAVAIRHGLESRYNGSVEALVAEAKSLTLLTRSGAEVNVSMKRQLGDGSWEGDVLRSAKAEDAPPLGGIIRFRSENVFGGTL
jgi:hypothetical protein